MIVLQAMTPPLIGIGIGLAAAHGLTRPMASLFFDVKPNDPVIFAPVAVLPGAIAPRYRRIDKPSGL